MASQIDIAPTVLGLLNMRYTSSFLGRDLLHPGAGRTPRAFLPAAHQFEVFLKTLIREVGKRGVLSAHPFRAGRGKSAEGAEEP